MTAPGPRPRPAQPADVPGILGLICELATYEQAADQVQATAKDLDSLLFGGNTPGGVPAAHCLVIPAAPMASSPAGGELAAMALWYLTTSTWTGQHGIHLEDLYVRPQYRGSGYGVALMSELASICLARGYQRLEWAVLDWNTPALEFYRHLGAQVMGEWITHRLAGRQLAELAAAGTPG